MKLLFLILYLLPSAQGFSQTCATNKSLADNVKYFYDTQGLLYKKLWFGKNNVIDSVKLYSVNGSEIKDFLSFDKINQTCIETIKKSVLKEFNWENVNPADGEGKLIIRIVLNTSAEIWDVRVIHGIHSALDAEIIRAIESVSNEIYITCTNKQNFTEIMLSIPF